jgi:hypothetical protein
MAVRLLLEGSEVVGIGSVEEVDVPIVDCEMVGPMVFTVEVGGW